MNKQWLLFLVVVLCLLVGCTPDKSKIEKQIDSIQSRFNMQQVLFGDNIIFPSNLQYDQIDDLNLLKTKKDINILYVNRDNLSKNELFQINQLFLDGWIIVFYDISYDTHLEIKSEIDFYSERIDNYQYKVVIIDYQYHTLSTVDDDNIYIDNVLNQLLILIRLRA